MSTLRCKTCGKFYSMTHTTRKDDGMCFTCSFWTDRWGRHETQKDKQHPEAISFIVNGGAYIAYHTPGDTRGMGFGGSLFIFERLDTGERIESRDVWHQGTVPNNFRKQLPDNAKIVPPPPRPKMIDLEDFL